MVSRWAISSPPRMVMYASRWVRVPCSSADTKWTFIFSLVMPVSQAHHSNSQVNPLITVPACQIIAIPKHKLKLFTLRPVPDMFDYLPPGSIALICPSSPINLCYPQCTTSLQPRIYILAHCQTSHSTDSCWSQIVRHGWVWDDTQSSTAKSQALKEV